MKLKLLRPRHIASLQQMGSARLQNFCSPAIKTLCSRLSEGRRIALSFNAIKSIGNATCDMDDVIGAAPDCVKSDKMIQHALDVDLAERVNSLAYIDDKKDNPRDFCYFASDAKEQIESVIFSTETCVQQIAAKPEIVMKGKAVSSKQSYEANRFHDLLRKVTDYRNAQHCP